MWLHNKRKTERQKEENENVKRKSKTVGQSGLVGASVRVSRMAELDADFTATARIDDPYFSVVNPRRAVYVGADGRAFGGSRPQRPPATVVEFADRVYAALHLRSLWIGHSVGLRAADRPRLYASVRSDRRLGNVLRRVAGSQTPYRNLR